MSDLDLDAIEARAIGALRALEYDVEDEVEQVCTADIPALCAEVRRLRAELAGMESELRRRGGHPVTLSERLRAAATAERLSDWVRVEDGWVYLSDSTNPILGVVMFGANTPRQCFRWLTHPNRFIGSNWSYESAEAAIRAGLLALAEREEASC